MSSVDKLAKELKSLINESDDRKPKAYDTDAQVVRIEDDILWVHIPGGVEETPVKKTINALPGDTVKVHIENGGAWVSGNASAPPTDDRQANIATNIAITADNKADEAVKDADRARIAADAAEYEAGRAKEIAEGVEGIARRAEEDAGIAKTAANESLKGLGMTQEVLDVVNWVATHGVYVKATTYVEGTSYYTVSAMEVTDPSQQTDELVSRYYEKDGDIYVKTEDTEYDDSKTYYVVTGTPVPTPKSEDIGQYYTLNVKDAMGDYINSHLALTNEGLYIMADDSEWKVKIADDGVYILDPNNKSANTMNKDGSVIGYEGETRTEIDYHSLKLIDKEGYEYLHISDLRNQEGIASILDKFTGDDQTRKFNLTVEAMSTDYKVTVDLQDVSDSVGRYSTYIVFSNAPESGSLIMVEYFSEDINLKAFTFGTRNPETEYRVGVYSMSLGRANVASGAFSYAEGHEVYSLGNSSHAEGCETTASGPYSHAEGYRTIASDYYSHAEGSDTTASGFYSHAEGYNTTASGRSSHAEGRETTASGPYSHAEGYNTTAIGDDSHAEGYNTTASANFSHAEGHNTNASGSSSHAEGGDTIASGIYSHAEGCLTTASGVYSHAQNIQTIANRMGQTAIGRYNIKEEGENDTYGTYALIIGNGTSNTRSNALTVDWNGNVIASGTIQNINFKNQTANKVLASPNGSSGAPTFRALVAGDISGLSDHVTSKGTTGGWVWRKWNSGKIEAWYSWTGTAGTFPVWATPIRYKDFAGITIGSGIFTSAPRVYASSTSSQSWVIHAAASSATAISIRMATVATGSITPYVNIYAVQG